MKGEKRNYKGERMELKNIKERDGIIQRRMSCKCSKLSRKGWNYEG